MKTKILLTVTATLAIALSSTPSDGRGKFEKQGYEYGNQQIVVKNYYVDNGYEYSSRIKRFHSSYSSFDFYSPVYTETYWYHFTPYTWGVSIYDDWYYYGAGVSRYSWRSGFGGSYWWGYDPWRDYNPWMGWGWNSWYSPGYSFGINVYLGRPQYHYPVAWNRWNYHQHWDSYRPVYIVNNNNYYNSYNNTRRTGYNPSNPNETARRSGYTVTSGRSTGTGYSRTAATTTRSQETRTGTGQGNRINTGGNAGQGTRNNTGGNTGQGNTNVRGGNERDKSNNGIRMGQYRRGVAEPTETRPNEPARPNNPNVNDRVDPGREKSGVRIPVQSEPRRKTQGTVRTTTRRSETTVQQGTTKSGTQQRETTVRKNTRSGSGESSEKKSAANEKSRRNTASSRKK